MRICFVCLGNICRSPMAAALLRHHTAGDPRYTTWSIDSCGTGAWHVGNGADPRTLATLQRHRISIAHRARQLRPADYRDFDLLLGMDDQNLTVLRDRAPRPHQARLDLLGSFDPEGLREVADPYYGDDDGFERMYTHLDRCCRALMEALRSMTPPAP